VSLDIGHPSILTRLRERGFRCTTPRRVVVEAVLRRPGRFTAAEIVRELREDGIGRATVFRTLDLLAEVGFLDRFYLDRQYAYALCRDEHGPDHCSGWHLVCKGCAAVEEVAVPPAEQMVEVIAGGAGFQPEGHWFEILGLCRSCQSLAPL
jgi:Fe2+ or Zn2+ uptake regulation protein